MQSFRLNACLPILLVLMLLHCGDDQFQNRGNMLRIALHDNPTNLDPRTHTDAVSYRIIELVYDFLVRMDSTGVPELGIAENMEISGDTEYRFKIRKNVTFHDGSRLTAHDVAYTFESILAPELGAPLRGTLESVLTSITVEDSFTITFRIQEPHAPFLSHLQVGIVPKSVAEAGSIDLKKNPIGSGPFRFVEWQPDAFVLLNRNPNYWQGSPRIESIQIKIMPEATTRVLALDNNEIDLLINSFPEIQIASFRNDDRFRVSTSSGFNYEYLGLNQKSRYLSNLQVRQAVAHAIDVEAIIQNLSGGLNRRANSLLSEKHWGFAPDLPVYAYDPQKARDLLDAAGFPDPDGDGPQTRFILEYKSTDKLPSRQKAQIIQQQLVEVGIEVDVKSLEWGTFIDDIQGGRYDLFSLQIVGIYEPDVYRIFFLSGEPRNRIAYSSPAADRLIEAGQHEVNAEKRRQIYQELQHLFQKELPVISLWHKTNLAVMVKRLEGFKLYPTGEWRSFDRIYFEESHGSE